MAASSSLPNLRPRWLLRRFEEQACNETLPGSADHDFTRTGRDWTWCFIDQVVMELG